MSKAEFGKDVHYTAQVIEAGAIDGNSPPGEAAMFKLSQEDSNPIVRRAALLLRTKELIRQNPPRRRNRP